MLSSGLSNQIYHVQNPFCYANVCTMYRAEYHLVNAISLVHPKVNTLRGFQCSKFLLFLQTFYLE
jgi:hypothetical protein